MESDNEFKVLGDEVMGMLLKGDYPKLNILREQWNQSSIEKIELTGVGFFIYYQLPKNIPTIGEDKNLSFGDVYTNLEGLKDPAGYVLFVENGKIKTLEGYITDKSWPKRIKIKSIYYLGGNGRNWEKLKEELGEL